MYALLILTFGLGLAPASNPTLPDGFYEILDKGAGTSFPCNDGRDLILRVLLVVFKCSGCRQAHASSGASNECDFVLERQVHEAIPHSLDVPAFDVLRQGNSDRS
jgi:hypothetical protein